MPKTVTMRLPDRFRRHLFRSVFERELFAPDHQASLDRLQHRLAVGILASFIGIVAAQGPLQHFVLCVGADGHVAIEVASGPQGRCLDLPVSPTPPGSLQFLAGYFVLDTDCGDCRDLSLTPADALYAPSVLAPAQSDAKTSPELAVVLVLPPTFSTRPSRGADPHRQPATLSTPLHLRSTVLLI